MNCIKVWVLAFLIVVLVYRLFYFVGNLIDANPHAAFWGLMVWLIATTSIFTAQAHREDKNKGGSEDETHHRK